MSELLEGLLPWHVSSINELLAVYHAGALHPAIMICGQNHSGKRRFTSELASSLLCQAAVSDKPIDSAEHAQGDDIIAKRYCGKCQSCLLVQAQTHPDHYELTIPDGKKSIPIDSVREIQAKLQQTAQMQGSKVCCIWPADGLNDNSSNALLKLLEEPPSDTYFILMANSARQLLPTISSRCLKINLSMPTNEELRDWLASAYAGDQVDEATRLSRGFPEKAAVVLGENTKGASLETMVEAILSGSQSVSALTASLESVNFELFLDALVYRIHDSAINEGLSAGGVLDAPLLQEGLAQGSPVCPSQSGPLLGTPLRHALAMQSLVMRTRTNLRSNPNKKLFIESFVLNFRQISHESTG
jgi:DNA polymerase-3 subunit delta'